MTDESRFILCPHCNAKTRVKITQDTVLKNFPLFCPKCKRENVINVENYIITLIRQTQRRSADLFIGAALRYFFEKRFLI